MSGSDSVELADRKARPTKRSRPLEGDTHIRCGLCKTHKLSAKSRVCNGIHFTALAKHHSLKGSGIALPPHDGACAAKSRICDACIARQDTYVTYTWAGGLCAGCIARADAWLCELDAEIDIARARVEERHEKLNALSAAVARYAAREYHLSPTVWTDSTY